MAVVLDASAALPWVFPSEATSATRALFDDVEAGELVFVPAHWPLEVTNALLVAIRAGRATHSDALVFIKSLAGFRITVEAASTPTAWLDILRLAEDQRLTAYDAAYLWLAMRKDLPIATLDGALVRAAREVGVRLTLQTQK